MSYLKLSEKKAGMGGAFFVLSLALHAGLLGLLFVPLQWGQDLSRHQPNVLIQGFNVELVDVTMNNVKFNPKDFEKAKVVRKKVKRSEQAQNQKSSNVSSDNTNSSPDAIKAQVSEGGREGGTDLVDRDGFGHLDGETKRILMSYKDYLSNYLNHSKQYPRMAEKLRQEGLVILVLVLDAQGTITDLQIKQSSNHRALDIAAVNHVRALSPFKELPQSVTQYRVEVPIVYKIN